MSRCDTFQSVNNKGADQTAWMRRLVCAFIVRKAQRKVFSCRGPNGPAHKTYFLHMGKACPLKLVSKFGLSLHLQLYSVYASSEGPGESGILNPLNVVKCSLWKFPTKKALA